MAGPWALAARSSVPACRERPMVSLGIFPSRVSDLGFRF